MPDYQQRLTLPATGGVINLPACSDDTDALYRSEGWVPFTEGAGKTKAELLDIAAEQGVDIPANATKAEIAAALNTEV